MISVMQRLNILYRLFISFGVGYLCCYFLAIIFAYLLNFCLPKAESVFLSAFITFIFYVCFVIATFCIQSLKKLSLFSLIPLLILSLFSHSIG